MRKVRKLFSVTRVWSGRVTAQEEEKPSEVLPTSPKKVKVYPPGKSPRHAPKKEYPTAEEDKVIDLTQQLSRRVAEGIENLIRLVEDNLNRIDSLQQKIKQREQKLLEMDKSLKKWKTEHAQRLDSLLNQIRRLFEYMEQYKATGFKYKEQAEQLKTLAMQLVEVPTGRITQAGLKKVLEMIEREYGIQLSEQKKMELMVEAQGSQLAVLIDIIEEQVQQAETEAPSEEGESEHTSSVKLAISWSAIMTAIKELFGRVKDYVVSLVDTLKDSISSLKKGQDTLEKAEKELKKVVESAEEE